MDQRAGCLNYPGVSGHWVDGRHHGGGEECQILKIRIPPVTNHLYCLPNSRLACRHGVVLGESILVPPTKHLRLGWGTPPTTSTSKGSFQSMLPRISPHPSG